MGKSTVVWIVVGVLAAAGVWWALQGTSSPDADIDPGATTSADQHDGGALAGRAKETAPHESPAADGPHLHGRVLTEDGQPVAGVGVGLWLRPRKYNQGDRVAQLLELAFRPARRTGAPATRTTTGGDGSFRLPTPSGATGWADVTLLPGASHTATLRAVRLPSRESTPIVLVAFAGTALRGRVVDAEGAGLEAHLTARMFQGPLLQGTRSRLDLPVRTDAKGRFSFSSLPTGSIELFVHAPGHGVRSFRVGLPRTDEVLLAIREEPGARVHGIVRDTDGAPAPNAKIALELRTKGDKSYVAAMTTTDADGRYACAGLPPGLLERVVAEQAGFRPGVFLANSRPLEAGGAIEADIVLQRGATLRGVVQSETGGAVAQANVHLRVYERSSTSKLEVTADAEGRFEIPHLPPGTTIELAVHARGLYQPEQKDGALISRKPRIMRPHLGADGSSTELTVIMAPGVALRGRCETSAGAAVVGAMVRAMRPTKGWDGELHAYYGFEEKPPSATSDVTGRFTLPALPPGTTWMLDASTDDQRAVALVPAAVPEDGSSSDLRIVMDAAGTISGTAVTPTGDPVSGLRVRLKDVQGSATTDPTGAFAFRGLSAGTYRLDITSATRKAVAPAQEIELRAGEVHDVRIVTRQPLFTSGRVLGADGEPMRLRRFSLQEAAMQGRFGFQTISTDGEGRFQLTLWDAGSYRLRHSGHPVGEDFAAGTTGIELRYAPPANPTITIRIMDPDGKPVPTCKLSVMTGSATGKSGTTHTVSGGVYLLKTAGLETHTDLSVGGVLDSLGQPLNVQPANLMQIDKTKPEVVIRLRAGRTLTGRVVGPAGEPAAGVSVRAPGVLLFAYGSPSATTDEDGRFEMRGLPTGELEVKVASKGTWIGSETIEVAAGQDEVQIVLQRGLTFTVLVVGPDGEPVPGVTVNVTYPQFRRRGPTDAEGRFVAEGVDGTSPMSVRVDTRKLDPPLPMTEHRLVPFGEAPYRIALRAPVWIEGTTVDENGKPAGNVSVSADGQTKPRKFGTFVRARSDAKTGRFRLGPLEPGTYLVTASGRSRDGLATGKQIEIEAPSTKVELRVPRSADVAGRIMSPETKGWYVTWRIGGMGWSGHVNADGRFTISNIADSIGTLWAAGPDGRYAVHENVRPGEGPFELKPLQGATLEGTIEPMPTAKGVRYFVSLKRGGIHLGTSVREDGTFTVPGIPPGRYTLTVNDNGGTQILSQEYEPDGEPLKLVVPGR